MAKTDKRSKRDKLKDGIVDGIHSRIEQLEAVNKEKAEAIERDKLMIGVLRRQISDIEDLCKSQDGKKD